MNYPVFNTKKQYQGNGELTIDDEGKRVLSVIPDNGREYIVQIEMVEMKVDFLTLTGPRTFYEVK